MKTPSKQIYKKTRKVQKSQNYLKQQSGLKNKGELSHAQLPQLNKCISGGLLGDDVYYRLNFIKPWSRDRDRATMLSNKSIGSAIKEDMR